MRNKLINIPRNRQKLPNRSENANQDFYIFPFYPALGFTNRGDKTAISEKLYNSIIQGNKPIILKWLDSEGVLDWENPDEINRNSFMKRSIKIGEYFTGKIINSSYSTLFTNKNTGFTGSEGQLINYTEQSINKTITIHTTTQFFFGNQVENEIFDSNLQRLFFVMPEISGRDVLIIETMNIYRDDKQGNKFHHLEITFRSLGDELRAVGKTLDGLINFNGIGEQNPFPQVAPKQKNNNTNYYDVSLENLPNTKKVYIHNNFKDITKGAKYYQIEFNGVAGVYAIGLYGRTKNYENNELVGRYKPLLTSKILSPFGEQIVNSQTRELKLVSGKLQNINFFEGSENLTQYGFYFDPNKSRTNSGIVKLLIEGNKYQGTDFFIGDNDDKTYSLYGNFNNAYNKFVALNIRPYQISANNSSNIGTREQNVKSFTGNLASVLNTNWLWNIGNDFLEYEGIKINNKKGLGRKILNSITSIVGGIATGAGAIAGGGIGAIAGAQASNLFRQLGNSIFDIIPDSVFTTYDVYRPSFETSFLLPKNFCDDVYNKLGDDNKANVPLSLFENDANNYLSGMTNSKIYNVVLCGEITDIYRPTIITTSPQETRKLLDKTYQGKLIVNGDTALKGIPVGNDFIIDLIEVKAMAKVPFKISFYDDNRQLIWETTMLTNAGYHGNILDYNNFLLTSDYDDNGKAEHSDYKLNAWSDARIVPQIIDRSIVGQEREKQEAMRQLRSLSEIQIINISHSLFNKTDVEGIYPTSFSWTNFILDNSDSGWDKHWESEAINLIDNNRAEYQLLKKIYYNNLTAINTTQKIISILRSEYGFNFRIDTTYFQYIVKKYNGERIGSFTAKWKGWEYLPINNLPNYFTNGLTQGTDFIWLNNETEKNDTEGFRWVFRQDFNNFQIQFNNNNTFSFEIDDVSAVWYLDQIAFFSNYFTANIYITISNNIKLVR